MRIAMFSPSLPRPFGTADARWLFVCLSELARRGHEVELVCCTESDESDLREAHQLSDRYGFALKHIPMVIREPKVLRRARSLRHPHSEYQRVAEVPAAVARAASRADLLHIEHLFPSWLALKHPQASVYLHHLEAIDWTGPRVLSHRDRLERAQVNRATHTLVSRHNNFIVATPRIGDAVHAINAHARIAHASVALDTSLYPLLNEVEAPTVGVVGSMHWYPSRSAAERVLLRLWPQIRAQVPDARLVVAGFGADQYLGHHFPIVGAELLGTVARPEDFFGNVNVLLYPPERGSGMKIKALESFGYGVPVVSNTEGLEGLVGESGVHYLHADTDSALVAATVSLLNDRKQRQAMRLAARELLDSYYSPVPAVDRLIAAWNIHHDLQSQTSIIQGAAA